MNKICMKILFFVLCCAVLTFMPACRVYAAELDDYDYEQIDDTLD